MDPIVKLLWYFNSKDSKATYYNLTDFVLHNLHRLSTLSISDFAEETFVSKATITRFIHFLGLENYKNFKSYFGQLKNLSKLSFLKINPNQITQLQSTPEDFFQQYAQQVILSIQDTASTIDINAVDALITAVLSAEKVAFLGYSDSNIIAKDIQLGCLGIGKICQVADTPIKFQNIIEEFTTNDLIVILSNYGNFFTHYENFYKQILSKNVPLTLVTQNYSSMDSFRFQQTIYLTSKRQLNVGNYPMRLFSEYFVRRIMFRLQST